MNKLDNPTRDSYLKIGAKPLTTNSSILVSSSKYLNSARLREALAQEALKCNGPDLPTTYCLPELAQAINACEDYQENLAAIHRERELKPEFGKWLDQRFFSNYNIDDVKDCKPGTLGAIVHDFMVTSGMDVSFQYKGEPAQDDLHYYQLRSSQSHDIEHLVTGFEPNPYGENALIFFKAYREGKYFSPEVAAINGRGILTAVGANIVKDCLHYPAIIPHLFEGMAHGINMAKRGTKIFLYTKWEDYWDVQLSDVREEFSLYDAPEHGAWDWTEALRLDYEPNY
jgi:ubiquinone biosynthesis protein COQ4